MIDWDDYFLEIAKTVSLRSNCIRAQVGAVIVSTRRHILATGYNGVPSKVTSCLAKGTCYRIDNNIPSGTQYETCLAGDTVIKLLDGTYKTIQELSDVGREFWIYSIDTSNGRVVPALATNPRMTGIRSDILEITLDNNKTIRCTSDHKFMMRDGSYKEARELLISDSLMPLYYNFHADGREVVSNTIQARKEKWGEGWISSTYEIPTHRLVHDYFKGDRPEGDYNIHHKNLNKLDNRPDNLILLTKAEHSKLHNSLSASSEEMTARAMKGIESQKSMLINNPEYKAKKSRIGRENMTANWNNPDFLKGHIARSKESIKKLHETSNKNKEHIALRDIGKLLKGLNELIGRYDGIITDKNYDYVRENFKKGRSGGIPTPKKERILKYFNSVEEALSQARVYNHKVKGIKKLDIQIPVYDLTVEGYENFAVDLGDNSCIFVHNCRSIHAEQNAIIQAGESSCQEATMYVYGHSHICILCKRFLIQSGICKVILMERDSNVRKTIYIRDLINEV